MEELGRGLGLVVNPQKQSCWLGSSEPPGELPPGIGTFLRSPFTPRLWCTVLMVKKMISNDLIFMRVGYFKSFIKSDYPPRIILTVLYQNLFCSKHYQSLFLQIDKLSTQDDD